MSFTYSCDWCGRDVVPDDDMATLSVEGTHRGKSTFADRTAAGEIDGYLGHYHQHGCWEQIRDRVYMVHEHAQALESIPTISGQAVAARRRKHTRTDEP